MRLNPGAITSGLRIEGFIKFGPLTENLVYTLLLAYYSSSKFNPSKWPCCGVYVRFLVD
jgi:hypothetical protein